MSDQAHEHDLVRKTAIRNAETAPDPTPDVNPLSRLQRMIGNRAVQRLMMPDGTPIQTKMTVTAADDAYESEADAVAEQVVQKMHAPDVQREAEEDELQAKRIVQREAEEDELQAKRMVQREAEEDELQAKRIVQREGEEEELMAKRIQRSSGDMMGSFDVGQDFEKQLSTARGGGKSLDSSLQAKMGDAMGADFSGVRVHEDSASDALNSSIQARAFTTGSDIFFKQGEYNPSSTEGQKLLAHELTHTVQQGAVSAKREDAQS
jgi:hypothetical protein